VWIQCTNVTDRRTDTKQQQRSRLCIASHIQYVPSQLAIHSKKSMTFCLVKVQYLSCMSRVRHYMFILWITLLKLAVNNNRK